ncbi:MAG: mechanosensitive ion channel family protein [Candidatus Binatus sp.]|uniref:mechanosensitive ion channel family protein n=1 Tax=Candidatus Binatus sp. TaxID=2811406 RepID=UPI002724900B|nr:mechanosensitive ion channel family protein [Candidatus Binatus sp.]MDO8432337.1 mechanosensitive ion channel family protein [Candidatus Binatus sp.]
MTTQLQTMLGLSWMPHQLRVICEAVLIVFALLGAIALRRGRRAVTPTTFMLLAGSIWIDALSHFFDTAIAQKVATAAYVLFLFAIIRLVVEGVEAAMRRGKAHFSTILKDLLMFGGWVVVALAVLYTDFGVEPFTILGTTTVLAAVLGFALQETLGNIFSGLTLQMSHPFEPGDWVRSGANIGRLRGTNWRSTIIMTRANERLEIPNSMIAKDVLHNYSTGAVADEVAVGISYSVPPNRVRDVVMALLRDVPQVLHTPLPEVLAWEYGDSAIKYRIKYWISDYGTQELVRDRVVSNLWYALRRHSIEIPFPIRTIKMQPGDGVEQRDQMLERELISELRQVEFLKGLPDEELRVLLPTIAVRQFGAGEMLVRQGDQGETLYIIRSGVVDVIAHTPDGNSRLLAQLTATNYFGEGTLMTGEPRTADIRAASDVEVIEMDREGLRRLFKEHPEAATQISEIVAARMEDRLKKLAEGSHDGGRGGAHRWLVAKMRELFDL